MVSMCYRFTITPKESVGRRLSEPLSSCVNETITILLYRRFQDFDPAKQEKNGDRNSD